ncbi:MULTISPECIES: type II toxin-antitoxin system VapC family toxin [Synechocystis]|uniref:Type II toxin-antitoxin system VapC family toxin n=1 Tax=Synechocystis salina LEGE 00031 TaxID=1828736 RepID=A0ABR9VSF5_9SYNC|nr:MULTISPECIES: type II toxin-antitoxin system VapC family toxin [Synechocystis]MBE9195555.1 type II toxin-antitoxin system VapC family toxin [Synechocystis sp. LEGE 06083]MBE9240231.1 type II toxin-antitoxin system VapC family toxin [Synechocystis salina LEGE 00041]MBE9253403.1 type II toxin-antitoxin system VapC family toxin [Synechocystis salina LEGE 00031]
MIVLDTHAWFWWLAESPEISRTALDFIQSSDVVGIPAISCWELAMLVSKERIQLSMDVQVWMDLAFQHPKVTLLPLTSEIAVLSTRLPGEFHGDPADRLIVATCLVNKSYLVTKDKKITSWNYLPVIW